MFRCYRKVPVRHCLYVCLSVCLSRFGIVSKRLNLWVLFLFIILFFCLHFSTINHCSIPYQVPQQQYADDTQLYVALSPVNYCNEVSTLQSCLSSIHVWFCENGMALNSTKSDAILFGTSERLKTVLSRLLN